MYHFLYKYKCNTLQQDVCIGTMLHGTHIIIYEPFGLFELSNHKLWVLLQCTTNLRTMYNVMNITLINITFIDCNNVFQIVQYDFCFDNSLYKNNTVAQGMHEFVLSYALE